MVLVEFPLARESFWPNNREGKLNATTARSAAFTPLQHSHLREEQNGPDSYTLKRSHPESSRRPNRNPEGMKDNSTGQLVASKCNGDGSESASPARGHRHENDPTLSGEAGRLSRHSF